MKRISFATGGLGRNELLENVLSRSLQRTCVADLLEYGNVMGDEELRWKIAALFDHSINADNVLITSSAQQGIKIALEYASGFQNRIMVQEPAYFGAIRVLRGLSVSNDITPFSDIVEKHIHDNSVVYITSNYHNPTGASLLEMVKDSLVQVARSTESIIIEDNPHDFLYYEDSRPSTLFDREPDNVIYVSGFSKILAPGLRIGYMIAAEDVIQKLKSYKITEDVFSSTIGQKICLAALAHNGYFLDELRKLFFNKRKYMLFLLRTWLSDFARVSWNKPGGGIFIQLKFEDTLLDFLISEANKEYNLLLEGDSYNYLGGKESSSLRINFVQNSDEDMEEGIKRLHQLLLEYYK